MLSDTKKEYFKKLLSQMLDEVLKVESRSMDKSDGFRITQSDPSDRAIAELESTFSFRMQERKGGLIKKIEAALERIEDGTYGICEECEKLKAELEAIRKALHGYSDSDLVGLAEITYAGWHAKTEEFDELYERIAGRYRDEADEYKREIKLIQAYNLTREALKGETDE